MAKQHVTYNVEFDNENFQQGVKRAIFESALLVADLEYRLTVAHRVAEECPCAEYLVRRRIALLPELVKKALLEKRDPAEVVHEYARAIHVRHEAGKDLDA